MKMSYRSIVKKAAALLMCAAFAFAAMPPAESLAADTHDEGKTASRLICRIFQHSPVFRIGGDEFSVILQNEDYENREALANSFGSEAEHINASAANAWEEVRITMGVSTYEPGNDRAVIDTVRRADKDMYENKRARKAARG